MYDSDSNKTILQLAITNTGLVLKNCDIIVRIQLQLHTYTPYCTCQSVLIFSLLVLANKPNPCTTTEVTH